MRKILFLTLFSLFLALVILPATIVLWGGRQEVKVDTESSPLLRVLDVNTNKIIILPLEEYLVGVVAAEMPALFEVETLKAQAVAARTYAIKKFELGKKKPNTEHPKADICTNSTHCQAWVSKDAMRKKWGLIKFPGYYNKITKAINDTHGVVLVYQGKLIDPVYHSTSIGKTENSGDVWQFAIPYLKSVPSPGDKESPKYQSKVTLTLAQVDQALGTNLASLPAAKVNSSAGSPLKVLEKSTTGRVKKIQVGNKEFKGEEFRSKLGLGSTFFTWQGEKDQITFTVTGYGHGVGMSQYGANYFAKQGQTYKEILAHYYTGTELRKYNAK
jgi:stage II sporulation protein D